MTLTRVLVVEDDPGIQRVIRLSLAFRGVNDITLANDGEECLALVDGLHPDVILLDISMPRLDGYETCRRLKASAVTRSIPVIFLTAKAQKSEEAIGFEAGALGYLTKPFDPLTLHQQIVEILDTQNAAKTS